MNVNDGGGQPILRDTIWKKKVQRMVNENWVAKGLKTVLSERGLFKRGMTREEMVDTLSKCEDFAKEKSIIQKLIEDNGHVYLLLPKFHCELNPIERCWAFAKKYVRERSTGSIVTLRALIDESFQLLSKDMIRKFFRKVRKYEKAYRKGGTTSSIEKYVKTFKDHRRIRNENE